MHFMKIFKTALCCLVLSSTFNFAVNHNSVELRAGGLYNSSQLFRKIYGDWAPFYEIEGNATLCDSLVFWANFDWVHRHGKSTELHRKTRVDIANVSLGLKWFFDCGCIPLYVGIGPSFGRVWVHNDSCCVRPKESKFTYGAVAKLGVQWCLTNCVFLDLFVDYLYQPVHFHRNHEKNIGGVKPGIGIGMYF